MRWDEGVSTAHPRSGFEYAEYGEVVIFEEIE